MALFCTAKNRTPTGHLNLLSLTSPEESDHHSAMQVTKLRRLMSLFDLSESAANSIYTISNLSLVVGAMLALAGTLGVVWSGGIREEFANRRLSENSKATALANAEAGRANERAASLEKDAAVLQASIAPRRLTLEQQRELATKLQQFAGQVASTWYGAGDKESETFAREIAATLHAAKWTVFSPASSVTMAGSGVPYGSSSPLETGVVVASANDEPSQNAANTLIHELNAFGFEAKAGKPETRDGSVVIITVEARPEGAQGETKLKASSK